MCELPPLKRLPKLKWVYDNVSKDYTAEHGPYILIVEKEIFEYEWVIYRNGEQIGISWRAGYKSPASTPAIGKLRALKALNKYRKEKE